MASSMLHVLAEWFVFSLLVLYGYVYLLTDSVLLEKPREWFLAAVKRQEQLTDPAKPIAAVREGKPSRTRAFIGRMLSCWQCTSGWCALPAAGFTVGLFLATTHEVWWLVAVLVLVTVPPAGIGFTALIDHLSPKRASDRVVDAAVDIAQAILEKDAK